MNKDFIYLDHAAATPIDSRVIDVMMPYLTDQFFNPSSPYMPAVIVRRDYEDAKKTLANIIGGKPGEIIITAGATESINLAFKSISGHIVTSNIEHPAVLNCAKNHDNTIISADEKGFISADIVKKAITPQTQLVSIALANNEIGTIQPIRSIASVIKQERESRLVRGNTTPIYFHSDASQGVGQLDVNVARLGVDLLSLNAGKIYGPKQVGLLWAASHVKLEPLIFGGGQERNLRSGTENVAGTIGFAKALELAFDHHKFENERLAKLRDGLQELLTEAFPEAVVSGHAKHRLASHLHIAFSGIDGERLIFLLENRGVLVATGSACAANKGSKSHVLSAIGMSDELASGSIRMTLGHLSSEESIKKAGEIIIEEINKEYIRINR
ncbi:MAG: cysteine desulfurase family protein [Candidatus Saccharibacteria bacterium]